jgi:hypothetical protein
MLILVPSAKALPAAGKQTARNPLSYQELRIKN